MNYPSNHKELAADWFAKLRERICAELEVLEEEASGSDYPPSRFLRKEWHRPNEDNDGGGGTMAILRQGSIFEKAGVNISTVHGQFSEEFRSQIPGADKDGAFWASGISLVIHPRSPLVPAVHMNTRHIVTRQHWFGGGADLTPVFPDTKDSQDFHRALKKACDRFDPDYYAKYKEWCDRYFYLPHRQEARGIGGIFFDNLYTGDWEKDFGFTQAVGEAFLNIYPALVRRHYKKKWNEEQRNAQLVKRGRYVEFNLLYDRGTLFGLKTGGNIEAILMSLPPEVSWP